MRHDIKLTVRLVLWIVVIILADFFENRIEFSPTITFDKILFCNFFELMRDEFSLEIGLDKPVVERFRAQDASLREISINITIIKLR